MSRDVLSDLDVLDRLVQPAGKDVVDIGCGGGALVRALAGRGARMTGVEVSEEQLAPALSGVEDGRADGRGDGRGDGPGDGRGDGRGARYVIGTAQRLPLDDASVDAALFMRSLHHVPPAELLDALREARRVVRRDGLVYVCEPLAQGDYFELTRLVEDEVEVRAAAQAALERAADARLERASTFEYDVQLCFADLAAVRARIVSVDPARAQWFEAREPELADAFARFGHAGERPGERCFLQPMRADVLRPVTR